LRRHHVEAFADILADLRHGAATALTERARRLDDPLHPRQNAQAGRRDCDDGLDPARRPIGSRTPMAVWREGVSGGFLEVAVDMTLRLDNAGALPTCPQPQQQQQWVAA